MKQSWLGGYKKEAELQKMLLGPLKWGFCEDYMSGGSEVHGCQPLGMDKGIVNWPNPNGVTTRHDAVIKLTFIVCAIKYC